MRTDRGEVVVVALEAGRRGAVEHLGHDGHEALGGEAVGHSADLGVDAKGFLDDEEAGVGAGAGWAGKVGAHGGGVGDAEGEESIHLRPSMYSTLLERR